ncbi:MAG: CinA family protein [Candidatus Nanopelagicales bacterium]|jgi:nicotinamide-nucleotide amidase|nr:CinA family protein [Candidatus Nanopelagicales bacterium]
MATDIDSLAVTVILAMQGRSVATAESLTGGQLGSTITAIPGASKIYRGGVIAYATDLKTDLLGVSQSLLAEGGAVQAQVALEMATGAAQRLDAEFGLAVTGVAGPDSQDGHLPGTVFVACIQRDEQGSVIDSVVEQLQLFPEFTDPQEARAQIREETVAAALELLLTFL